MHDASNILFLILRVGVVEETASPLTRISDAKQPIKGDENLKMLSVSEKHHFLPNSRHQNSAVFGSFFESTREFSYFGFDSFRT